MKKLLFVLLVLGLATIASPAQTNASYTNLVYSIITTTNISDADVKRLVSRLHEYREGPIRGSTRDILELTQYRVDFLLRRQIVNDLGFTDKTPDQIDHRMQGIVLRSSKYGGADWLGENSFFNLIDSRTLGVLSGSVNVDQRLIDTTGLRYQEAERSWWREVKEKWRWGVTEQYAFVGTQVDGFLVNARYHYFDNFNVDQKIEGLASKPLGFGFSTSAGIAYSTDVSDRGEKTTYALRLNYVKGNKRFSIGGNDHSAQVVFTALH